MFVLCYFLLGPMLMSMYILTNAENNENEDKKVIVLIVEIVLFIALWVIALVVEIFQENFGWIFVGGIVGCICSIVTYNKNKVQTLIDIDRNKGFEPKIAGTDYYWNLLLLGIRKFGINSLVDGVPYICTIMQYFNKDKLMWVLNEYKPNLNIEFVINSGLSYTPLDYAGFFCTYEMFSLMLEKGAKSANNYRLICGLIRENKYDFLERFLKCRYVDLNKNVLEDFDDDDNNDGENITVLDFALLYNAHSKILDLLIQYGAKRYIDMEPNMVLSNEEVKVLDCKEISAEMVDCIKLDDIPAFKIAYSGAMGNIGGINFLSIENELFYHHINYVYGNQEVVNKVFNGFFSPFAETMKQNSLGIISDLDGWKGYDLGYGNELFIRNEYVDRFEKLANAYNEKVLKSHALFYQNVDYLLFICFNPLGFDKKLIN